MRFGGVHGPIIVYLYKGMYVVRWIEVDRWSCNADHSSCVRVIGKFYFGYYFRHYYFFYYVLDGFYWADYSEGSSCFFKGGSAISFGGWGLVDSGRDWGFG